MKVLAIDFETANSSPASACSIGLALFEDGELTVSREILIKPYPRFSSFNYFNMQIHHITPEMVADAESWPYVFNDIYRYFLDSVVIAHNAAFDMTVLRSMNTVYGIEMEDFPYLDTVALSRRIYPFLANHKLNTVAEYLNLDFNHHQAGSDALACLAIVESAMDVYGVYEIEELAEVMHLRYHYYADVICPLTRKARKSDYWD